MVRDHGNRLICRIDVIYLRADARARYGAVKEALDGIRDAGIDRITFLVEQERR